MRNALLLRIVLYLLLAAGGFFLTERWLLRSVPGNIERRCAEIQDHIRHSTTQGLRDYFPQWTDELTRQMTDILRDCQQQQARWFRPDYQVVQSSLEQHQVEALRLLTAFRGARLRDRLTLEQTLSQARERLLLADSLHDHAAQDRRFRYNFTRAQLQLETAELYYTGGAYRQAIPPAVESLELLNNAMGIGHRILARYADPLLRDGWRKTIEQVYTASRAHPVALLVDKDRHELTVLRAGKTWRTMPVDIGAARHARKLSAGDRATPEGIYRVVQKKGPGQSRFGLALLLDYPNTEDRRRFNQATRMGLLPADATIGGLIEIHGEGGRGFDWTDGCIAPGDEDMVWLFERVPLGTIVGIVGMGETGSRLEELSNRISEPIPQGG